METENEKGQQTVTQSAFDQASEKIADTMHKTSRAASAAVEAIEDGVVAARRAVKHGGYVAADLYDDAKRRVQKKPTETVVATFAAGIAVGAAAIWITRHLRHCACSEHLER
jgi:hypothetical protein